MIFLTLIFIGLAIGSFINALVWRLHEQDQLRLNKKVVKKESDRLSILHGRSMCPNCKHELQWFDLLPVLSWLQLRGKCRYCKKSISWQYPLGELVTMGLLVISYSWWPLSLQTGYEYLVFIAWIPILTILVALAIYDLKWMELPTKLIYILGGLVTLFAGVQIFAGVSNIDSLLGRGLGAILLGGFFWVLYQISNGKWIGGGDVRYGFVMGFLLSWQGALLGLTVASYLGTIVFIVLVLLRKYHRRMRLPFGPFLIAGTYCTLLWGQSIIDWYLNIAGL